MNAFMLYTKTYHKIINADPDVKESYVDLFRLVPQLNQLLSCTVCSQLLLIPYSPKSECQHHICKSCIGVKKKFNCSQCDDHTDYFENQSFRLLLQCYKKLCKYFMATPMYKALEQNPKLGEVGYVESICKTNLLHCIQDGVLLKDTFSLEESTPSTCRLSTFLNKNGFPLEFGSSALEENNSDQDGNGFDIGNDFQIQNSNKTDIIESLLKELPLFEEDDALTDTNEKSSNNNTIEKLPFNDVECGNHNEDATYDVELQVQIQNSEDNDDFDDIEELPLNEDEYNYLVDKVTVPIKSIISASKEQPPRKVPKLSKRNKPAKKPNPMARRRSNMKGCRCGKAAATPGNLICCGQRCPCYANGKPCLECQCKGCRNTHTAAGFKLRPYYPDLNDRSITCNKQSSPVADVTKSIDTGVVKEKDTPGTSQPMHYSATPQSASKKQDAPLLPHVLARLSPTRFFLDEDSQDDFEKT